MEFTLSVLEIMALFLVSFSIVWFITVLSYFCVRVDVCRMLVLLLVELLYVLCNLVAYIFLFSGW